MIFHRQPVRTIWLVAILISILFSPVGPALAQCPTPSPSPPVQDGILDDVYEERGFVTNYTANNVNAAAKLHQIDDECVDPDFVYLAWEIERGFVDNSYGGNRHSTWPQGHGFEDLCESDGQRLQIQNVCGEDVVDIFMDFLDADGSSLGIDCASTATYPGSQSGFGVGVNAGETVLFGINGGDWSKYTYATSELFNLENYCEGQFDCDALGTDLLVDSPPWSDEANYVPTATYSDWEYNHIYEIRIDRSVFQTADCAVGTPALIRTDPVELHASPSKIGESPVDLFRAASAIGDYVWLDADRDGIQDAGETGLSNVTLDLYTDDGDGIFEPDTAVIDGELDVDGDGTIDGDDNGAFDFDDDGVADATVIGGLLDLDGDGIAGETNGDDSGTLNTVTVIDGRLDLDGSGVVDAADDGLFAGDDGVVAATTVTDSNGRYTFTQLGEGNYFVDVTDENGVLSGLSLTAGPETDSEPSSLILLDRNSEFLDADFGYAPTDLTTGVVGDYIWSDADGDGIQDAGEPGIAGVTVDLVGAGPDGEFGTADDTTTTATTDATGGYLFFGVAADKYYVDVTDTGGVLSGYTITSGPQAETDPSTAFVIEPADVYLNADFGYRNPNLGSLGNLVWFDANENRFADGGEPGIGLVTVALIADADGDDVWDDGELIIASTTTDQDGAYTFSGLLLDDGGGDSDADYLVWVSDTNNVLGQFVESVNLPLGSTADNVSKSAAIGPDPGLAPYGVELSSGSTTDVTADFGYMIDNPDALVGDRVWYDKNADGIQDSGEPGIEDVRVILHTDNNQNGQIDGQGGNLDEPFATRTTDVNGNYFFPRLPFDNNGEGYIVGVSELNFSDVIDGRVDVDNDGVIGAADDATFDDFGNLSGFTVIDGLIDLDQDGIAGETNGDDTGTVSGFTVVNGLLDLDQDGTAGESNGDDSRFAPLRDFTQTGDPDEAGTCTTCDLLGGTAVTTGDTIKLHLDFGFDTTGDFSIGDTVYEDLDADGTQDSGEGGLELVTLSIYRDIDGDGKIDPGEPELATDVTDSSGNYLFDGLVADDYIIQVTDKNGILTGYTQTEGGTTCCQPVEAVTVGPSTLDVDYGFVRKLPATISNFVWEDLDGDGLQDAGEPGLRNVTVNLWNPGADGQPGGGDDTLVNTTLTDASGLYSFSVQAGDYFVEIVRPAGYVTTLQNVGGDKTIDSDPDPTTGRAATTSLIIGENDPTWDGGFYRPVAVGDRVWLDLDGDGVQDVGEPGIPNVTVELQDGAGNPLGTAVTDSNGDYLFSGRIPGTYRVTVDDSTLPSGSTLTGGSDPSTSSTLQSAGIVLDKDFGYSAATVGDLVWSDADQDGVRDAGEPGIGGVTLDLVSAGADGVFGTGDDVVEDTVTTAGDGSYYFTGVSPGKYRVDVTDTGGVLSGYALTSGPQSKTDPTAPFTVAAGDAYVQADFGYFRSGLGILGDRVWLDADGDGVRDAGEEGIAGVTLSVVTDVNGDGTWDPDGADDVAGTADDEVVVATTRTAGDGTYSFAGLALDDGGGDASYLVVVTDVDSELAGLDPTLGSAGVDDNGQSSPYAVTLSAGSPTDTTADFSYNRAGAIGDLLWHDVDGDGAFDSGEPGIGGVTIELRDSGGTLVETATTAADGSYLFTLLVADTYTVTVTDTGGVLSGYTQTADPDEAGACSTCDGAGTSVLAAGASDFGQDFGYRNPNLHAVSGTVFEDLDRDGFHDEAPGGSEGGFDGVTLVLWHDADGNGVLDPDVDERVTSTTTDGSGNYTFPGLEDDGYIVEITDAAGLLDGYSITTGLDEIGVTVAGADVGGVDFGYVRDPLVGLIGDTVWIDADGNGVRGSGETGIGGVTLSLYRDVDGDGVAEPGGDDGAAIATTTTDANGNYLFAGLDAGSYFVDLDESTLPAGLVATTGTADPTGVIGLSAGASHLTADFGYVPASGTAILGDRVWFDADGDGLQDAGENGISGVQLTIDGANLSSPVVVTTDARGEYLVTGLAPGDYSVEVDPTTLPSGVDPVPTNTGGDPRYEVTVAGGDVLLSLDFGYQPDTASPNSIGDIVFFDADADGVQDADEGGIGGVTLDLRDGSGNLLATTTTADDGSYLFSGLLDGDYQVDVTDTGNVLSSLQLTAGSDPTATISVSGGTSFLDADFGYGPGSGKGTLGNRVWHDLDGDGVRDAGEPGIQGVTLTLWRDVNSNGVIDSGGTDNRLGTVTTDSKGEYLFTGLALGASYLVDLTDTAGVLGGFSKTSGTAGADDNSQADPYAVTLTSVAPNNLTADFGYSAITPLTISGTVFEDEDQDAVFDDGVEFEFAGVDVLLYRVVGGERFLLGRQTTDAVGDYSFVDLPDGSYELEAVAAGSPVDGYQQTTQSGSGGIEPVTLSGADSGGHDFGFFQGEVSTTPVTLAYFRSVDRGATVLFEWTTATEVGNVGFHLWERVEGEAWSRLTAEPVPSHAVDSIVPQHYRLEVEGVTGTLFALEDLDVRGTSRFHGPFALGEEDGHAGGVDAEPVAWGEIRRQSAVHAADRAERRAARGLGRPGDPPPLFLEVSRDGVYRLSWDDLQAALPLHGDEFDVPASHLSLTRNGEAVPVRLVPGGRFGPGSHLEFVGEASESLYGNAGVYRLEAEPGAQRATTADRSRPRGAVASYYVEEMRIENESFYSPLAPNGDPWFDAWLYSLGSPRSVGVPFDLDAWAEGAATVRVRAEIWGATGYESVDPDHHVILEVNGEPVDDVRFDGQVPAAPSGEVPDWALAAEGNRLEVVLPGDTGAGFEMIMTDAYEIAYPRRFEARDGSLRFTAAGEAFRVEGLPSADVTVYRRSDAGVEHLERVEITGAPGDYSALFAGSSEPATYWVVAREALRTPAIRPVPEPVDLLESSAELLVISHPDFLDALAPLVDRRRSQGWSVRVADVRDVYARYAHGHFGPEGIRRYVADSAAQTGTTHVLLVGGDTYDYHDHLGLGSVSFLPSPYAATGDLVRFAPADAVYADVDVDGIPDVAIGRFPVRTVEELEAVVAKTLRYEDRTDAPTAVLAADAADSVSFAASSEQFAYFLPDDWSVERIFLDELDRNAARQELLPALDRGPRIASYMGHSGPTSWSFQGLFTLGDAMALRNEGFPFVVTQWGCWTTYYVAPSLNTLGHKLLLSGEQGAAAVLGAATLTEARSERILARQLYSRLQPGVTLGEALRASKAELVERGSPASLDVVLGWTLLGDPTLPSLPTP